MGEIADGKVAQSSGARMHADAHAQIFDLVQILFRGLVGKTPRGGAIGLGNMISEELQDETEIRPHMRGGTEAGVTECSLGSVPHEVLGVRPPGTLAGETGGKGAIAEETVHPRATQGQSDGQQTVERVGGHVCADAGCDEHLGSGGRTSGFTPGALAVAFQHAPMRQAPIAVAELEIEEADGPKSRPSLQDLAPFRQCTNPQDASAGEAEFCQLD